jgi:hypothetical protein
MLGGWGARVNYTWSRTDDNVVGEQNFFSERGVLPQAILNNYDVEAEFGRSLLDAPHRLNVSGTFELPFGEGRRWLNESGLVNALVGGWNATVVGYRQSGFPIRVVQNNNNSGLLGSSQRPNVVPGVNPALASEPRYDTACGCVPWLNPAAWSPAAPFTFGDAPRTDPRVRTPMRANWDLALQKSQRVGGPILTIRAELLNALNQPDLRGPVIGFGLPNFGQILDIGGVPRTLQLMVRATF